MSERDDLPRPGDALLLVDVQNDFLPGGALPVPAGDRVIAPLNARIDEFLYRGLPVFASRDWHPPTHCSFRENGGPWPRHCVAYSRGAAFAAGLQLPQRAIIVDKGVEPASLGYSAFEQTLLDPLLHGAGVSRLFVGGLATEYCVLATVDRALQLGYDVIVLADAVQAIDARPGDGERALGRMRQLGAHCHAGQALLEAA